MSVTAVVGAQWGDEGKGRIIDFLAKDSEVVIRFQGGDNAGHTVINEYGKFALHIIPSGIFNPNTVCIVGTGTVINPDSALAELALLEEKGVDTSNLFFSERAQVILPLHVLLDGLEEDNRDAQNVIGTTRKGVGPTYEDKISRRGIRMGDLNRPEYLRERLSNLLKERNKTLAFFSKQVALEDLMEKAEGWRKALGHRIIDTHPIIKKAIKGYKKVLLEGQLGVMRDLDWGIYPYVTSSNPISGGACAGAGIPPHAISKVVGVVKVYSTAVGNGPFPVELFDEDGEKLRRIGQEFGATTGRPRRCGWFDAACIQYSAWINGFTSVALTKLDVLDEFETIKICTNYKLRGEILSPESFPYTPDLEKVELVYEEFPGWMESTKEAREWEDLPPNAQKYVSRLGDLIGVPVEYISVGPERDQLIFFKAFY